MSSFLERDELEADTQEQRQWAIEDGGDFDEPQFELPPHLQEQAEDIEEEFEDEPEANSDPFFGFDPQVRQDIVGLTHLGHLKDDFSFCGHHFSIKTLHGGEELAAARAAQAYRGTLKEPEAWVWAQVAMSLTAVDGDPNFCPPIGPDLDDYAQARFDYCTRQQGWFYPLAQYIYFKRYVPLQERMIAAFEALQGKSERNRSRS
jgi:hypothetical protein